MSTHFDDAGHPRMVDVSSKPITARTATASCRIEMQPATLQAIRHGLVGKGDVLAVARLAAIQATKHTSTLIPLCHAIPVEGVDVDFQWSCDAQHEPSGDRQPSSQVQPQSAESSDADRYDSGDGPSEWIQCRVTVRTTARTGVEMEALTAASVAGLTIYDMCKSRDRAMQIGPILLEAKSGGASGDFRRH